jgi:hypothetical protein
VSHLRCCSPLQLENVQVTQVKTAAENGYDALQIGAGDAPDRACNKPELGHFSKAGVDPKRVVKEFRITPDAVLQPGVALPLLVVGGVFIGWDVSLVSSCSRRHKVIRASFCTRAVVNCDGHEVGRAGGRC